MTLTIFSQWMQKNRSLSANSIYKYQLAIRTISREMLEQTIISKPLVDMNLLELDIAINHILHNDYFTQKNKTGNNMYSNALKQFRYCVSNLTEEDSALLLSAADAEYSTFTQTEKEFFLKARIGQGLYRQKLFEKYNGCCCVTGIDQPKLLIASHIKPWSVCNDIERLDIENGFLLSANIDKLFDSGLITFHNNGKMYISTLVGKENEERLHISNNSIANLQGSKKLYHYLEYHRDVLFVK